MTQSVFFIGAGELGMAVLEALAQHPDRKQTKVSVLLRQSTLDSAAPEKKRTIQRIKALNGHFEAGELALASVSELANIFRGYDVVVCCSGMGLPSGTQEKIAKAVLEAKVKRYFPWQFGMDYDIIGEGSSQDLFDEQLAVRKLLRSQKDTKWTIVSTGVFMSFVFEPAFGVVDIKERTVRGLGSWDNRITATTPDDIGRVTADLILDPQDLEGESQVVYTAGDTVSYGQLADLVDARFGKPPFTRELWDKDALKKQMEEDPNTLVKYRDTFAMGRGVAWEKEQTINHKRGIPMTDVKSYLEAMTAE